MPASAGAMLEDITDTVLPDPGDLIPSPLRPHKGNSVLGNVPLMLITEDQFSTTIRPITIEGIKVLHYNTPVTATVADEQSKDDLACQTPQQHFPSDNHPAVGVLSESDEQVQHTQSTVTSANVVLQNSRLIEAHTATAIIEQKDNHHVIGPNTQITSGLPARRATRRHFRPAMLRIPPVASRLEYPVQLIHVVPQSPIPQQRADLDPTICRCSRPADHTLSQQTLPESPRGSPSSGTVEPLPLPVTPQSAPQPKPASIPAQLFSETLDDAIQQTRHTALAYDKYWQTITSPCAQAHLSSSFLEAERQRLITSYEVLASCHRSLADLLLRTNLLLGPSGERTVFDETFNAERMVDEAWVTDCEFVQSKVREVREELIATHCFWKVNYALCGLGGGQVDVEVKATE